MKKILVSCFALAIFLMLLAGCGESFNHEGHQLIGSWRSDDSAFISYEFHEDGTGSRGTSRFTWTVTRNNDLRLSFDSDRADESFSLRLREDGTFGLSDPNARIMIVQSFRPVIFPEPLVGTWVWDEDPSYTLIFNDTGRGNRGFDDERENFSWFVYDGTYHLYQIISMTYEPWRYVINDNILTITSRVRNRNIEWSYFRLEE